MEKERRRRGHGSPLEQHKESKKERAISGYIQTSQVGLGNTDLKNQKRGSPGELKGSRGALRSHQLLEKGLWQKQNCPCILSVNWKGEAAQGAQPHWLLNPNNGRKKDFRAVYKAEMDNIHIFKNMDVPIIFLCISLPFIFVFFLQCFPFLLWLWYWAAEAAFWQLSEIPRAFKKRAANWSALEGDMC